jgi:hypothetical protein
LATNTIYSKLQMTYVKIPSAPYLIFYRQFEQNINFKINQIPFYNLKFIFFTARKKVRNTIAK